MFYGANNPDAVRGQWEGFPPWLTELGEPQHDREYYRRALEKMIWKSLTVSTGVRWTSAVPGRNSRLSPGFLLKKGCAGSLSGIGKRGQKVIRVE